MLYSYSHVDMIRYSYLYLICIGCKQKKTQEQPEFKSLFEFKSIFEFKPIFETN